MSNQQSCRAAREARREVAREGGDGGKSRHEDAIARYLAAFAYAEEREEQRDGKSRHTRNGEAAR